MSEERVAKIEKPSAMDLVWDCSSLNGQPITYSAVQLAGRVKTLLLRAEHLSKHGAAGAFVEEVLDILNGKSA